ncbi:pentatricopeptide repeat-containing protein At4g21190 isoform X3 [Zea mays]|uniref:pentatricopeptide repeat-containing protein At4g21190 isoform X3 n=1 Tax=Zea mays TaxID=4577 RepID=UPI0002210D6E|nr:uncharacterized protein LOC100283869 isoform X3 [Zea mays]|eukprot:XP_008655049.1 EMB1417 isoform X3 [Zea mays]
MFCLRGYWSPSLAPVREGPVRHHIKFNSVVVCGARGPRPRYPRVWKTRKKIGTISKSQKLVECVIKWMFNKGQGKTMGSYYTLLNALIEDGRIEEAEELFGMVFSRYMEGLPRTFFMRMISFYYSVEAYDKMFEIFADMEELGVRPDGSIIRMLGDVFQKLEMMDKYEKLKKKYPPPKWDYRHIKGKRIRIRVYPDSNPEVAAKGDPDTDELEELESTHLNNELDEAASSGLDRSVLDDAASGDLEYITHVVILPRHLCFGLTSQNPCRHTSKTWASLSSEVFYYLE